MVRFSDLCIDSARTLLASRAVKVLAVTNDYPPEIGGIGRFIYELYRRLPAHGIDVRILAPAADGDIAFDRGSGLDVVRHPGSLVRGTRSAAASIRDLSAGCDAISLASALPVGFVAARTGLPIILHTHSTEVLWDRMPGTRYLFRQLVDRASMITVITDYTHDALGKALEGKVVKRLPPAVDLDMFNPSAVGGVIRERYGIAADTPLIVHAGRLVPRKGQDTLIEAMPAIRKHVPNATLLLFGQGPYEKRLRQLVDRLGLNDAVIFGGFEWTLLPEAYAAGDVFATPCRSRFGSREVEGLPQVFLEAQAVGRPVIVGNSGGAAETTLHGETGFVVDSDDWEATAQRVVELLADRERARTMGRAARKHVENSFGWDQRAAVFAGELKALAETERVA